MRCTFACQDTRCRASCWRSVFCLRMFSANRYLLNIDIFQNLLGIETMVGKVAEVSSGDKDYPPAVRPRVHRVPVHLRPPGCFVPACCICGVRYASEWLGVVGDSGRCWWPLPYCYRCCEMPGMPLRPYARSPLGSVALRAEAALQVSQQKMGVQQ